MIHAAALLLLSSCLPSEESAIWDQWRGPSRDGIVGGPRWPDGLEPDRLEERWRVPVGESYAGAVVTDRLVFSFESTEGEEIVRAFDRADGEPVWTAAWPGEMVVAEFAKAHGNWVRSTPAWDGAALFLAGMPDLVACVEGADGAVRWRRDLGEVQDGQRVVTAYGQTASPLVTDDAVYVFAGHALHRLDKRTGASVWIALEEEGSVNNSCSSPIIARLAGVEQLVIATRERLAAVDPADGSLLWEFDLENPLGTTVLTPIVHGVGIVTASFHERLRFVEVEADDEADGSLDAYQAWASRCRGNMTTPVVVDGHAYLLNGSNRLTCIDLEDGTATWTSPPAGTGYVSMVAQGDRILALAANGKLRLLAADPAEFTSLGETRVADDAWAHLAVVGSELYVRSRRALIAYDWR